MFGDDDLAVLEVFIDETDDRTPVSRRLAYRSIGVQVFFNL